MALLGSLATLRSQLADPGRFAPALECVAGCLDASSSWGRRLAEIRTGESERVELPGGSFALLQAYLTKPRGEEKWESHRAYVDVQALAAGEEFMGVADISALAQAEDLTPAKDVIFYHPFAAGSLARLRPGVVAIYFPPDGHAGGIAVDHPSLVRKVVVKVPAA